MSKQWAVVHLAQILSCVNSALMLFTHLVEYISKYGNSNKYLWLHSSSLPFSWKSSLVLAVCGIIQSSPKLVEHHSHAFLASLG